MTTTTDRILNFSAGPATLPESVLRQAQHDIWNIDDSGIGICEHSHRGAVFGSVLQQTIDNCRKVGSVPDEFEICTIDERVRHISEKVIAAGESNTKARKQLKSQGLNGFGADLSTALKYLRANR